MSDPIFAEVYAIPHKEFYDILDDEDRESLRCYGVSIDVSQQRFNQPMFYGKWKGLCCAKWTLHKKYFPFMVEKGKKTRTPHCSDTKEEGTTSMSEVNEDTASIIPPEGPMESTHTQINAVTSDYLQAGEPAVLNINDSYKGYGDITHGNTLTNVAKNTCLLGQHTQKTAVGSNTDIVTKTNGEKSDMHPDPDASHTTLKARCTMVACKGLKTCEGQHFSNSNESHLVLNTVEAANCKETESLRKIAVENVNAENDTNTEKLLHSAAASRSELYETVNNVQEKSNTVNDNGYDKDHQGENILSVDIVTPDEHYGYFHKLEEKNNGSDNKSHDIDRQGKEEKEIRRGITPTAQRDAGPSTVGPEDGMSLLDQSQSNANSALFTAENKEAPHGIPQQDSTLKLLRPAVNNASRQRSQSSAASTKLGTLVDHEWEGANDQGAHEGPRDNEREKDAERPNHEGDHNAQIGLQMEKNDGGQHRHNPTPTVNNLIEIDSVDHEASQALDYSQQGARPKTIQVQGRILPTENFPSFFTNRYVWLWYKLSYKTQLERSTCKYHCTMKEIVLDDHGKDLRIDVLSDKGGSEAGQLEVEKCMDDVTQSLTYIQSKHDIFERSLPSSFSHGIRNNINLPESTYVCDDLNKGKVIIGVDKENVQQVYYWLNPKDDGPWENHSPENTNTTIKPEAGKNDMDIVTDDEDPGENSPNIRQIEKTVQMDHHLFRYIGQFHKKELANISRKYKLTLKACSFDNVYGVRLQGFDMHVYTASEEITTLLKELGDLVQKDSIDVSAVSFTALEITRIIEGLKKKYECVLFEYKGNTILLIGYQEHIIRAKPELQNKLGVIRQSSVVPQKGNNLDQHHRTSPKRIRQLMQPLVTQSPSIGCTYSTKNGKKIHILKGDITKLFVAAVVNASNTNLEHGGGVAGAISKAAGPQMQAECTRYVRRIGALKTCDIYCSGAYNMPCQYIIHVAGPRWSGYRDKKKAEACLAASFLNVLAEADHLNIHSIAIPAVGSGIFGAPLNIVAKTMFDAVSKFVKGSAAGTEICDILLVDINEEILELLTLHYEQAVFREHIQSTPADFDRFIINPGHGNTVKADDMGPKLGKSVGNSQFHRASPNSSQLKNSSGPTNPSMGKHLSKGKLEKMSYADKARSAVTKAIETPQLNPGPNQDLSQLPSPMKSANPQMPADTDETCAVCMEALTNKEVLPICNHAFCKNCIDTWFKNKPTCPICCQIHGEIKGDQPRGSMTINRLKTHLPGYDKCRGTIVINYNFPAGKQEDCHPNPGRMYQSIRRTAYLPDTVDGRRVLDLLTRAFNAKLTFTIGRSTTTGKDDQITWNDIHHKTNQTGGPARFGYPDANYLTRVKEELAAKGIK